MRKKHTENDEIKLRLVRYVGDFYDLQWRYDGYKKILWFKIRDSWKRLPLYVAPLITPKDDPRNGFYWNNACFDIGKESDMQHYEALKKKVKTKKDLWREFHVDERNEKYQRDLSNYFRYREKVNETRKRLKNEQEV